MKAPRNPFTSSPAAAVDQLVAETDSISLQRIDEAASVLRPGNLGVTHGEREFDSLSEEQASAWPAEAEVASRPPRLAAARVSRSAEEAGFAVQAHRDDLDSIRTLKENALQTLLPFVRRSPHDDARYWLSWAGLGLGDTAGVWGAAISLGEIPELALGQALATGLAAVTAGLVGGELRTLAHAKSRQRDPDSLTDDERRYRRLFEGADTEKAMTKLAASMAITVGVLVTGSIFALRASTEGNLAAIAFGCMAFATALASFISSYIHADEVADLLATYDRRYRIALKRHARASKARPISRYAAADTETGPVKTEAGRRLLPLTPAVRDALLVRHIEAYGEDVSTDTNDSTSRADDLVFLSATGTPVDPKNFVRTFHEIREQAGLPRITVHHTRHTAATSLKNLGVPARDAQLILGHSHITTTQQLYQHGDIKGQTDALTRVGEMLTATVAVTTAVKTELSTGESANFHAFTPGGPGGA